MSKIMTTRILMLLAAMVVGTTTLHVSISPQHAHLTTTGEELVVRCAADSPITSCHIRVGDTMFADLSRGRFSDAPGYTYEGDGLVAGHCGARLNASVLPQWGSYGVVQCRVLAPDSDWAFAIMSVNRNPYSKFDVTTKSRLVVATPGEDIDLLFQTGESLVRCELHHPQVGWKNLVKYPHCSNTADSLCYLGQGLIHKECGVHIKNITAMSIGFLWFHMETPSGLELHFVQVVVIKPPQFISVATKITGNINSTLTMEAWCTIHDSRPKANISWSLEDHLITDENIKYVSDYRWFDQHEVQSTTQKLTMPVNKSENGRELWCIASHEALHVVMSRNKTRIVMPDLPTLDPCRPSPCGGDRRCISLDGKPLCECVLEYFSSPNDRLCLPECVTNPDCPTNKTCKDAKCVDPCPDACGLGASCTTINHSPVCSCPVLPVTEGQERPVLFQGPEVPSTSTTLPGPDVTSCGPAALEEHRVRLLHLAELHKIRLQLEQARASVEKENAIAARARARVEEENILTARARAKNAEEELEFQRELRRTKLQHGSELGAREEPSVH